MSEAFSAAVVLQTAHRFSYANYMVLMFATCEGFDIYFIAN